MKTETKTIAKHISVAQKHIPVITMRCTLWVKILALGSVCESEHEFVKNNLWIRIRIGKNLSDPQQCSAQNNKIANYMPRFYTGLAFV
jgi:hypothetical protein